MTNATLTLTRPYALPQAAEPLQLDHREETYPAVRCWMTQTSASFEAHVLGGLTVGSWRCRLQTEVPVAAGWRASVTLDADNGQAYEYEVKRATRRYHTDLFLERVS